jgi:hypothetical protein
LAKDDNEKTVKSRPFGSNGRVQSNSSSGATTFADASNFYANYHHNWIQFTSIIDQRSVKFKAFLTQFEDQFKSEWNSEQVYGRNDPIQTFRNTTRAISLGWDTPAASIYEAKFNMHQAAGLIRMLYPGYRSTGNVSTLNQAPLIRVKFRNLIKGKYEGETLLVSIDGINFSPDLEAGFFDADESKEVVWDTTKVVAAHDELIPKLLKFSCNMTVLHSETVGFDGASTWPDNLKSFPNLPKSFKDDEHLGLSDVAISRSDAFTDEQEDFNFDEEAAAAAADQLAESNDESSGDLEISDSQKTRKENKPNRQERRAKKTENKIKEAESAAFEAELERGNLYGTGAKAADARDRQGLSYKGQKYRKRKTK